MGNEVEPSAGYSWRLWGQPELSDPRKVQLWISYFWALRVAATLFLADRLHGTEMTAVELASSGPPLDPEGLDRLLQYLSARGVFREVQPGVYSSNDRSDILMSDHPSHFRDTMDLEGPFGRRDQSWSALVQTVRTGRPAYDIIFGNSYASDLLGDSTFKDRYDDSMIEHAKFLGPQIAAAYSWQQVDCVVDVGGGTGTILMAILRAHPRLRGILVETPHTARAAARAIQDAGLSDRCQVLGQDFTAPLPAANVYLLSRVLHGLDDEDAKSLLRHCKDASAPDSHLLVAESIQTDRQNRSMASFVNLAMLVMYGSAVRERTREQLEALAVEAGCNPRQLIRLPSGWGLLECRL